jgi:la-related protein 4
VCILHASPSADQSVVLEAMKTSKNVVLSEDNLNVRPNFTNERTTIILREIPSNTSVDEVKALFSKNVDLVQPSTVRSDIRDHWFIQFDKGDDCLKAFMWLNSQKFKDKPIRKRIKSENILRGRYNSPEGG